MVGGEPSMTQTEPRPASPTKLRSVGVIGGGTSGYFAAIALKKRFPALEVTIVESSSIPIIGVGEATTTLMPPFLHEQLGLDIVALYREVRPTWKLGIKFDWGLPGDSFFTYPFGETNPVEAVAHDGDLLAQSFTSMLMVADKSPMIRDERGEPVSLLPRLKFAYHLDNAPFVAFLARHAARLGVHHRDVLIADALVSADGERIDRLRTSDGEDLSFDLYIDATGFRSQLIGKALGSPFHSFAGTLLCDTAIVAQVPQRGPVQPYTLAQTMNAGWCWKIPVEGEDHRGYVFSSAFLSDEQAIEEMRAKNPGMSDPWKVRFRSGRHQDFWKGNVVAIGNAYGFVEPLESTALHMVITEIAYVVGCLESAGDGPPDTAFANTRVGGHWDYLRGFLGLHYRFNKKLDTPFWQACRNDIDVTGVQAAIDHYRAHGPWSERDGAHFQWGDPAFGYQGMMILLLGQQAPGPRPTSTFSREVWRARVARQRELAARALPQAEALAILRERPELLEEFVRSPASWCGGGAESVAVRPGDGPGVAPKHRTPPRFSAWDDLLGSLSR
jgi:tryptophan halogenase